MPRYLADTTILIESFRKNEKAKQFLLTYTPHISDITTAELLQGARDKREETLILKTCAGLSAISLTTTISQKAIKLIMQYHLSHGLLILDALIAATAIENKLTLVTENVRDFRFIGELQLMSQKEVFARF